MKKIVYRQRGAFRPKGDVQAIGECLENIKRKAKTSIYPHGEAPVEAIIEEARDPDSPLHENFTWDQSEAARKYNLIEARRLWTCYEVVEISRDGGTTTVEADLERILASPANVSIFMEDGTRRYVSAIDAMTVKENELQLIKDCEAQLRSIMNRLENLKRLVVPPKVLDHLGKAAEALAKTRKKPGSRPKRQAAVTT